VTPDEQAEDHITRAEAVIRQANALITAITHTTDTLTHTIERLVELAVEHDAAAEAHAILEDLRSRIHEHRGETTG
jgi:hypothetical protein